MGKQREREGQKGGMLRVGGKEEKELEAKRLEGEKIIDMIIDNEGK